MAGEYRLGFDYGWVFARFRMEPAPIEIRTFATHSSLQEVKENGYKLSRPRRVFAMVFRSGTQRILCVSSRDSIGGDPVLYVDSNGVSRSLPTPIRRIAVSEVPVSDFKLEFLPNDNLRMTWKEGAAVKLLDIDRKRENEEGGQ